MVVKELSSRSVLRLCLFIGLLSMWLLLQLNIERLNFTLFVPRTQTDTHGADNTTTFSGYLVNTNGCRIPDLDPLEESIQKYIFDEEAINCEEQYGPALVESNLTSLYLNKSVFPYYNITEVSQLNCCYTPFWRVEVEKIESGEYPSDVDSQSEFANNCTTFSSLDTITDEFVKVQCFLNNTVIYTDYHSFTPIKPEINRQTDELQNEDAVSVLIFGVDTVSRLNLYRQMPETVKFLKKRLNAVEMLGYNKVEDNTFLNLVPVSTGLTEEELKEVCWPTDESIFDNCTFIWDHFRAAGYKTAFAEDASDMGLFSYLKYGFRKQPTDYYWKVFNRVSEEDIGFESRSSSYLCVGPRKNLNTLLSYAYKFAGTMKDILSFGFFWGTSLSHDILNLPKKGDMDHKQFLENLYNLGIFNKTVLVFMSDHGIRWGDMRGTYQGYLEERLPFLFIVYPDWFREKYTTAISNFKKNAHKLTTPFDLHELLLDLLNTTEIEKDVLRVRSEELEKAKPLPRGISLFLPIPGSRSCSDSGIVDHWCTCHQSSSIPTNHTLVRQAASYLVKHINFLLKDYSQCAKLLLSRILTAREEKSTSHSNYTTSDVGIRDFSLSIETTPGKALFEATIRHNGNTDKYTIVGTVSRINLYGDQSRCVSNYRLRLYCYCVDN